MEKEMMAKWLPEKPPEGLLDWAVKKYGEEELGGEFCIFTSERVTIESPLQQLMGPDDDRPKRTEWAAVCTCTACKEDFITQKEPGEYAIRLFVGEDGSYYTVEPGTEVDPYMGIEINREGDDFYCPLCGSKVELIHTRKLNGGRTKRILVISVENVQGYTALIYWMIERYIEDTGIDHYEAVPEEAYVLTEHGGLVRYSHVHRHGAFLGANRTYLRHWKQMSGNDDVIDKVYPDWRSINNKKCGADIWPNVPDLEGSSGEKTALDMFIKVGGWPPVTYLKLWRRRPAIENLCRQGQAALVASICSEAYRYSYDPVREAEKCLDLTKKKPHEILGVSREEFRWLRKHDLEVTIQSLQQWQRYRKLGGKLRMDQFMEMSGSTGIVNMRSALELMEQHGDDLDKLKRYLCKSGSGLRDAGVLLDTRAALLKLYNRPLTSEELWPRHLHEAHDRAHRMLIEQQCKKEAQKLLEGFTKIIENYGQLEWTDGNLSVILPRNNGELVREGKVLRHCVGSYGNAHVGGSSVIFFIRHYRRPERPYYTLAINMQGKPHRNQLHGYGNERHGKNKEYTHTIPQKVRDFCDRWENEVLLAWYAEQQKQNMEAKTA